ncbi:MAG: hypothetical protein D6715_01765 [Calditrichaeota bacterium]|nr:MAG: hypothetical protein D6715_01765 [Calditrichota bacterium]
MHRILGLMLLIWLVAAFQGCGWLEEKWTLEKIERAEYTRDGANPDFVHWLNHRNPAIRLRATVALGRIQDSSRVVLLANRLADADPAVREAAAFALGQLFNPVAEPPLIEANRSEQDQRVKRRLAEALGKVGTARSFPILADYLESTVPELEKTAALACGIQAYREVVPVPNIGRLSTLLLKSPHPEARWTSAYALFRIHNLSTTRVLFTSLNDSLPYVRYFALQGLGLMFGRLNTLDMNRYRNNPVVREALVIRNSEAFGSRVEALAGDSLWYLRLKALEVIGLARLVHLKDLAWARLKDAHPAVRMKAMEVLGELKDARLEGYLEQVLADSSADWRLRGQALVVLADLDSVNTLQRIAAHFNPSRWPQNYFVIKALEKIRSQPANQLLIQLADAGVTAQATLALEVLVDLQRPRLPARYFLDKLKLGDPAITTVVATHFRYRKDTTAIDPLLEAYSRFEAPRDMETLEAVLLALDSLATPRLEDFFRAQLANPYPRIRQIALDALLRLKPGQTIKLPPVTRKYAVRWDFPRVDAGRRPRVRLVTNRGNIDLELRPDKAPVTVANFLYLARQGFYNGIYFHRVVPGFVVQAGDPRGDGWGGPGYAIPCEYNDLTYQRGVVGMAHAGKDTGGSQFFITHLPQPHLNGRYTAFGRVVAGMEVVDSLMVYDQIKEIQILNE